jgi:formate dehydrogenase major subunit
MFAEIDPILAAQEGIEDGGWMTITSPRGEIAARARVTARMRPLTIDRSMIHQIGLPWHWGGGGPVTGDAANDLILLSGDPNTSIHESKAFVVNVRAGRHSTGTLKLAGVRDSPPGVAPNKDHPAEVTEHE